MTFDYWPWYKMTETPRKFMDFIEKKIVLYCSDSSQCLSWLWSFICLFQSSQSKKEEQEQEQGKIANYHMKSVLIYCETIISVNLLEKTHLLFSANLISVYFTSIPPQRFYLPLPNGPKHCRKADNKVKEVQPH